MRFLLLFALFVSSFSWSDSEADYLLVITSPRNAETIAEAARLFQQANPERQDLVIKARTADQMWRQSEAENQQLLAHSRAVLGFGLYGASVANLDSLFQQPLIQTNTHQPRLLISSDHRLVALSQFNGRKLFDDMDVLRTIAADLPGDNFQQDLNQQLQQYPQQRPWLQARGYWHGGGAANTAALFGWLFQQTGESLTVEPVAPTPQLQWLVNGKGYEQLNDAAMAGLDTDKPVWVFMDHAGSGRPADSRLLQKMCQQAREHNAQCLAALAYWGEASVQAAQQLLAYSSRISAVVMLQDFVIGGGEGRSAVTDVFSELNVPVIKAIKLRDRTTAEWRLSSDGIAHDKVYYQVAMPELQGASQPLVIATLDQPHNDERTGIQVQGVVADKAGIDSLLNRAERWHRLQATPNRDKRIAIIYYNHPPGRHNIGADNLDVPASLWQILNQLQQAGYNTGTLPESQQALLDMMQARGVNLPRDAAALASMSSQIATMSAEDYQRWFATLPAAVQQEMEHGPFGLLHQQMIQALQAQRFDLADEALHHTMEEMHHLLEGVDHPGRPRALALLEELEHCYDAAIDEQTGLNTPCLVSSESKPDGQAEDRSRASKLIAALQQTGIEGLGGWGAAPGKVMSYDNRLLLPGLTFGNVFIGPQPPRGWEINEELLHANLAFPPPHQYLAFYHYLHDQFKADAFVHLGRHSTYEFLPHRSVGLADDDYSRIIAGDVPGVYPYIVDGVGEGIQAKRRGLAVMVDHLTPPLASTPLYDELLQLRQLIESFEANHGSDNQAVSDRLIGQIRDKVDTLELKDELAEAMSAELAVMGIRFEDVDDDMLVHEIGHYLTDLQERFMPLGLHVFGKRWDDEAIDMMLDSMLSGSAFNTASGTAAEIEQERTQKRAHLLPLLQASPDAEMTALLNGLAGGYVAPGQGNDPIRSPDSLPTGRNFYALDSSLIPSRVAWQLGQEMARSARANNSQDASKSEAVILWASDVVRDEGVMVAFGLDMLGLEPVWNSRGLVKGLQHQQAALAGDRPRRDIVFTTSGLFRDLYGHQMALLDQAVLLALDASSDTIRRDYPALTLALAAALEGLGERAQGGDEPLGSNQVAAHWLTQAQAQLAAGTDAREAGIAASLRIFGDAPGSYGAGINRLVERSGAWQNRSELAEVYLRRLGHSYGSQGFGRAAQGAFETALGTVENTYFGRSSNLYGLIDNNDAFDYLGGLSLAVESITGSAPNNYVMDHSDPNAVNVQPLGIALRQELRGRYLNPAWLEALMEHGYAGARTMGSEFLEYLWGWQVTNPTLVGDWAWEEVKAVYIDDRYQLQLDDFLAEGHNAHVKSNMLAIMLVAAHKGFWQADDATLQQLASEFAELVARNGLPGSGHTDPDNPMLPWLQQYLTAEQWQPIATAMAAAKGQPQPAEAEVHRLTELTLKEASATQAETGVQTDPSTITDQGSLTTTAEGSRTDTADGSQSNGQASNQASDQSASDAQPQWLLWWPWLLALTVALLLAGGFYRGRQQRMALQAQLSGYGAAHTDQNSKPNPHKETR